MCVRVGDIRETHSCDESTIRPLASTDDREILSIDIGIGFLSLDYHLGGSKGARCGTLRDGHPDGCRQMNTILSRVYCNSKTTLAARHDWDCTLKTPQNGFSPNIVMLHFKVDKAEIT